MGARTQKAKGILNGYNSLFGHLHSVVDDVLIEDIDTDIVSDVRDLDNCFGFPLFARPCPMKPRHGFVESRIVKNKTELVNLWNEVKKHDPSGEIILCKFVKSNYNAIITGDGLMSLGQGHDGATAGKDSLSIRISPFKVKAERLDSIGFDSSSTPYVELVSNKHDCVFTQLRSGPSVAHSVDYVPSSLKVKKIVWPEDDLLKWEGMVKKFGPGTVVYGPGHTLSSHAAVHCVINNVPFITSFKPKVGQVIKASKSAAISIKRKDFQHGVSAGLNYKVSVDKRNLLIFSLGVLHNWPYIMRGSHAGWLLGAASAIFCRLATALLFGELRHMSDDYKPREKVYHNNLKNFSNLNKLQSAFTGFYSKRWVEGYGGLPWANCTYYTHNVWKNIVVANNKKGVNLGSAEIANIVDAMNKTITLAHNGGWWFDKISDEDDADMAANDPYVAMAISMNVIGDIYYKYLPKANTMVLNDVPVLTGPHIVKNGKTVWAYGQYSEYSSDDNACELYIQRVDRDAQYLKTVKLSNKIFKNLFAKRNRFYLSVSGGNFVIPNTNIKVKV